MYQQLLNEIPTQNVPQVRRVYEINNRLVSALHLGMYMGPNLDKEESTSVSTVFSSAWRRDGA